MNSPQLLQVAEPPLLVDEPEAARRLGISYRKLLELRQAGKIRAKRLGRQIRYPLAELQRFADQVEPEPVGA